MRNIKMSDADAGKIQQLLLNGLSYHQATVTEVDQYEAKGFKMDDGSPMAQSRVDSLKQRRDHARTEATERRRLADLFLGSN